jgi:two-component system response regulator FixJ
MTTRPCWIRSGIYLELKGVSVTCHSTADEFLASGADPKSFDCAVADVRMPGMSGLDFVKHAVAAAVPIVLITGHGDVEMAVAAIKLGAFDFIEKPFDESRLLAAIHSASSRGKPVAATDVADVSDLKARRDSLTERQRQVMELAAAGLSNKEIGIRLGISGRTVENHRAWMMERMGARNLAELVRMDMRLKEAG